MLSRREILKSELELSSLLVAAFTAGEKLGQENAKEIYWTTYPKEEVESAAHKYAEAILSEERKRYTMTDFPPDHPCHMTAEDHKRVIQKHLGNGQALASSPGSPITDTQRLDWLLENQRGSFEITENVTGNPEGVYIDTTREAIDREITCSPDNCAGSGDCVQCCPDCDSLRSYGYDDGPCDRHKHQTPNPNTKTKWKTH